MKFSSLALAAGLALLSSAALAADLPVKALPFAALGTYPTTKCGFFYGLDTAGAAGTASSSSGNAGLIGGDLGVNVGYTCPIGKTFAFVDAMFDLTSIGGVNSTTGLTFSGRASFEQRFAIGAPLSVVQQFINLTSPGLNDVAMPSVPALPNGLTVSAASPYIFGSIHEDDVSAQLLTGTGKSWLVSYGTGAGAIYRVSNGWVIDVWAEYVNKSTGLIAGAKGESFNFGNGFKVGAALKF